MTTWSGWIDYFQLHWRDQNQGETGRFGSRAGNFGPADSGRIEVEGVGDYQQPHCPKCGSLDVTFQQLNQPVAYGSAWLSIPLPVHYKAWRCRSCEHEWKDEPSDANPEP